MLIDVNLAADFFGTLTRDGAILVVDELVYYLEIRIKFRIII